MNKRGKEKLTAKELVTLLGVQDDDTSRARANTIHSIVFNVPVTEPKRDNSLTQSSLPPISTKLPKINVTAAPDKELISNNNSSRVKLPKI